MAAALVLKGLNPGAALVYLLAGPATNLGSVIVLLKVLGRRAVFVYLAAVAIVTLAAGLTLNALYSAWGLDPRATFGTASEFIPDAVKTVAAALLVGLLIASMMRTRVPESGCGCATVSPTIPDYALPYAASPQPVWACWPCFGSPAGSSWSNPARSA